MPENNPLDTGFDKFNIPDISEVVFEDLSVEYDGNEHELVATNIPEGVDVEYTNNKLTDVGSKEVTATFSYTYLEPAEEDPENPWDPETNPEPEPTKVTDVIDTMTATLTIVEENVEPEPAEDTDLPEEYADEILAIVAEENNFNYLRVGGLLANNETLTTKKLNEFMEAYLPEEALSNQNHYKLVEIYKIIGAPETIKPKLFIDGVVDSEYIKLTTIGQTAQLKVELINPETNKPINKLFTKHKFVLDGDDNNAYLSVSENGLVEIKDFKAPQTFNQNSAGNIHYTVKAVFESYPDKEIKFDIHVEPIATKFIVPNQTFDLKEAKAQQTQIGYLLENTFVHKYSNIIIGNIDKPTGAPSIIFAGNSTSVPKPTDKYYFEVLINSLTQVGDYQITIDEMKSGLKAEFTLSVIDTTE